MKILCFNHHPDVLHYAWRAFTELGHDVHLATEDLHKRVGFKYTSTKKQEDGNQYFEVVDRLILPHVLFRDMEQEKIHWADEKRDIKAYDLVWAMLPEITSLRNYGVETWYDCQMQGTLRNGQIQALPGIKTCNHPDAEDFNFRWMPNWTAQQPDLIEPRYVTQLITEMHNVDTTGEMLKLRANSPDIYKIYGGEKCPDGFIRDINILPYTALLVHNKDFGCNCYAVCKALDMGIPVYMSRKTKERIGFGDLPDWLFHFKEESTIEEAYGLAVDQHAHGEGADIQETYRSIYTLERTVAAAKEILDGVFV